MVALAGMMPNPGFDHRVDKLHIGRNGKGSSGMGSPGNGALTKPTQPCHDLRVVTE
jgi:hypothetical protein